LQVLDERGVSIGSLREILQTGANDVFVVGGTGTSELLLPAIESVILEIDMLESKIRVRVPDGLVPEPVKAAVRQASRVKKRHARP
jgi:16S rRNA processing protein RimM